MLFRAAHLRAASYTQSDPQRDFCHLTGVLLSICMSPCVDQEDIQPSDHHRECQEHQALQRVATVVGDIQNESRKPIVVFPGLIKFSHSLLGWRAGALSLPIVNSINRHFTTPKISELDLMLPSILRGKFGMVLISFARMLAVDATQRSHVFSMVRGQTPNCPAIQHTHSKYRPQLLQSCNKSFDLLSPSCHRHHCHPPCRLDKCFHFVSLDLRSPEYHC